jgi:inorganic pyrophosphatase
VVEVYETAGGGLEKAGSAGVCWWVHDRGRQPMTDDRRPTTDALEALEATIEIPRGSRNKIEYDHDRHVYKLDRVLYSSVHYPTDYGFIPDTLSDDGDPLDVLVLVNEPTFTGCVIPVRAIGVLDMRDEAGIDHKILAVPTVDPRFDGVEGLYHVSAHWLREIENFFETYKSLEHKWTEIVGWQDAASAREIVEQARAAYRAGDPGR